MPAIIRDFERSEGAIIEQGNTVLPLTYFKILHITPGNSHVENIEGYEIVYVVLSGTVDIDVGGVLFRAVGKRNSIWDGGAEAVYAPPGFRVRIFNAREKSEIAVAGGKCRTPAKPFRITPESQVVVEVGSIETHSRRVIRHILGSGTPGVSGNLLVAEIYIDPGCWSGYPPHKHDEDVEGETSFEEVYHYRFKPENGFGVQIVFQKDGTSEAYMIRNGDTVLIDRGYHPTGNTPGHAGYIFAILVGKSTRSLVQNFKEEYRYLNKSIPGIQAMIDKFRMSE